MIRRESADNLLRLPAPPPSPETLFFKAHSYFASIFHDLKNAESSVDIEMYTWAAGDVASRLFILLRDAVMRGVRVRLLVDGIGSFYWAQTQLERYREAGIQVKVFRSLLWTWSGFKAAPLRFLAALNRRDHRKLFLVDGKVAYTGSMNVTQSAFQWRETGVRLTGAPVRLLQDIFEDTWGWVEDRASLYTRPDSFRLQARILQSPEVRCNQFYQLRRHLKADLCRRIESARDKVWLATPYFVPTLGLLSQLMRAANRGIDVRILLPYRSDVPFLRWFASQYYRLLLGAGAKLYEFQPQVLHAKAAIIDSWAMLGSSNLNRRSSFHDLELDIVLRTEAAISELEDQFVKDIGYSRRIPVNASLRGWRGVAAKLLFRLRHWC